MSIQNVRFVDAVGVAPGTTSLQIDATPSRTLIDDAALGCPKCIGQSTWWTNPANPGTGLGRKTLQLAGAGTSIGQLLFGIALGGALAYGGVRVYKRIKSR